MYENLKVILYPDPRLKLKSNPVAEFDSSLKALSQRMLELMREHRGVGLAAPQVGINIRLFVMNPDNQPGNDRVYVNPKLEWLEGEELGEEGCLSLPDIHAEILRGQKARLVAQTLDGQPVEEEQSGFVARIWQHEIDHLDGVMIIDRMGFSDKMKCRKQLKELEAKFAAKPAR
jgi:peptide deformylase